MVKCADVCTDLDPEPGVVLSGRPAWWLVLTPPERRRWTAATEEGEWAEAAAIRARAQARGGLYAL